MAFQKGNKLGGRKPGLPSFAAVLGRAIAQDDSERLRAVAEKLLDLAAAGEPWAAKELMDRLDGKARQQIEMEVDASVSFSETVAKAADIRGKIRNNPA